MFLATLFHFTGYLFIPEYLKIENYLNLLSKAIISLIPKGEKKKKKQPDSIHEY